MRRNFFQIKKYFAIILFACLLPSFAFATDVAGTVSFVIGDATTQQDQGAKQTIARGDKLRAGQTINTGSNGHVHIQLIDGAFVSIRPSSRFVIEAYHVDQADPKKSKIRFNLEQGTARSITGKAGALSKESFRLNTPLAAIGIRGTDFVVQADANLTRVTVQSGAVVMTPFGDGCLPGSAGSCLSSASRVLTAAMRDAYLELMNRKEVPKFVPVERAINSPNRLSPPRPEEPEVGVKEVKDANVTSSPAQQDINQTLLASAITSIDASLPLAKPPEASPDGKAPPPASANIWWGRWEIKAGSTGRTVESVVAYDREITMSNVLFGMFREKGDNVMPNSGVATFQLAESETYLMAGDRSLTAASISSPTLTIEFGRRRFDTGLTVNVMGLAPTEIRATGGISSQGVFMTESTSPETIVAGSLSKYSDQAGYLFQRNLTGGLSIIGATRWIR